MGAAQERFAPDADFRYVGGDVALDFINTVDWTERGPERDRFSDYARVLEWARGSSLLRVADERRLLQSATAHPRLSAAALESAWSDREILQRVFLSAIRGRTDTIALDALNERLANAAAHLRLVRGSDGRLSRGWSDFGQTMESVLWPVFWAAADLLASDDAGKLRQCGGDDCGWLFVDRSRNGRRRWCEMSVCGTTEKNRRRAGGRR